MENPFAQEVAGPANAVAPQSVNMGQALEPAPIEVGPPKTPQEFAERKSAWSAFAQRLQNDPTAQQLMLSIGLRMMQPRGQGQTAGGHFAGAVGDALNANSEWQLRQREQARQDTEQARRERESIANVASTTASTERTKQQTTQEGELFPGRKQIQGQQIQEGDVSLQTARNNLLVARTNLADLNAKQAAGLIGSEEYYRQRQVVERDMEQARLALLKAQEFMTRQHGVAYGAAAQASTARADNMGGSGSAPRQALKAIDNGDGTTTMVYLVNGKSMKELITPPVSDKIAEQRALKEVETEWKAQGKSIPGAWDKWGTPSPQAREFQAAVNSRKQMLMQPRSQWFDETNRPVQAPVDTPPATVPTNSGSSVPSRTSESGKAVLNRELREQETLLSNTTDSKRRLEIQNNIRELRKELGLSTEGSSVGSSEIRTIVRGSDGQLRFSDEKPKTGKVEDTDPNRYTRERVRGGWSYSVNNRMGKSMTEWAEIDRKAREGVK